MLQLRALLEGGCESKLSRPDREKDHSDNEDGAKLKYRFCFNITQHKCTVIILKLFFFSLVSVHTEI